MKELIAAGNDGNNTLMHCPPTMTSQNASIVSRNLSASMRDNYEQHGVAEVRLASFESR
jgi:hypothetical protein